MQSDFSNTFPLRSGRVHEVCGPASAGFSAISVGYENSSVLWIHEKWRAETVNPVGLNGFFDPSKLLFAHVKDHAEGLAVMEEALRDGVISCVIFELHKPLSLTAGRRLQLAAKEGDTTGICIIQEDMGSNAAETRWHCAPVFASDESDGDSTHQIWKLKKNKSGTLGTWYVQWDQATRRLHMVSPAGKRSDSAQISGRGPVFAHAEAK